MKKEKADILGNPYGRRPLFCVILETVGGGGNVQQIWNRSIHGELAETVFPSRGRTGGGGRTAGESRTRAHQRQSGRHFNVGLAA